MIDARVKDTTRIACIGECMVELSDIDWDDSRAALGVAGDTLNTAIYLARMLPSPRFEVSYITRLGQDAMSTQVLDRIEREGINTSFVGRNPDHNIGLYEIEVDADGERSFSYWRSQSAARLLFSDANPALDVLDDFDVIYLSAITLAIASAQVREQLIGACKAARAKGKIVVFDSNYRPKLWEDAETARAFISRMWAATSIALPSHDDECALHSAQSQRQTLDRIVGGGATEVALKAGAEGPLIWPADETPGYPAASTIVDTTGAGDAFNAAYLAARLTGATQANAARAGHKLASMVIGSAGAVLPPDLAE